jgi:putative FmdB family regulatory protein
MPTYVYRCPECEIEVEERRKMSQADDPLGCPFCGATLVRGITSFMFNTGRSAAAPVQENRTAARTHVAGCPCCYPATRR